VIAGVVLAAAALTLLSNDFGEDGTIPRASMATDCGGANRTPELHWSGSPATTRSFALVINDPDAPVEGGFYHWVVYDIPASTTALKPNAPLPESQTGVATTGKPAYHGPCPPPGPAHHYVFTLYALDVARVSAGAPLTAAELQRRIAGHVVAKATLTGFASH
jgi:hypothetical protein